MRLSGDALAELRELRESINILSLTFDIFAFLLEDIAQEMVAPINQRFLVFISSDTPDDLLVSIFKIIQVYFLSMSVKERAVLIDNFKLHVLNFLQEFVRFLGDKLLDILPLFNRLEVFTVPESFDNIGKDGSTEVSSSRRFLDSLELAKRVKGNISERDE